MFQFSASQKEFVKTSLQNNLRTDGRAPNQRRAINLQAGNLDNLAGSSHLRIYHEKCQIYTGVKLRVINDQQRSKDSSNICLQLSSMHKLNKEQQHTLSYLQQLLNEHFISQEQSISKKLTIPNSKKHHLQMHIECFLLVQPHISLLEPLYQSIHKALLSTSLPQLQCFYNEVTEVETVELTNASQPLTNQLLTTMMMIGCFEGKLLLDLTPLQFESVQTVFLVVVRKEKVMGIESLKGSIASEEIQKICRFASQNRK